MNIIADIPSNEFEPQRKILATIFRSLKSPYTNAVNQTKAITLYLLGNHYFTSILFRIPHLTQTLKIYILNNAGNWEEDVLYKP